MKNESIEKVIEILINSPKTIRMLMDKVIKKELSHPDVNISRYHFEVLKTLDLCGEMSISELGEILVISKSQMTRLISELSATDRIVRIPAPNDRRKSIISLTATGQECIENVMDRFYQAARKKLQPLSEQDLDELLISLGKVSQFVHKLL